MHYLQVRVCPLRPSGGVEARTKTTQSDAPHQLDLSSKTHSGASARINTNCVYAALNL
jgi:hypothetical protein